MQDARLIIYEQPLNDHIRACLRLEHLFGQIKHTLLSDHDWDCRLTIAGLIDAFNIVDRPDLKSKLVKALQQQASALAVLEKKPEVDQEKLQHIMSELDRLIDILYHHPDRLASNLYSNPFLMQIRQHMANPGGISPFSLPAYFLWLHKPAAERRNVITAWLKEFEPIKAVVILLLHLARASSMPRHLIAEQGFYQEAINPTLECNLVRISVPIDLQVYPEISAGRHRLSVRFYELNTEERPLQTQKDIEFTLTCCTVKEPLEQSLIG